MKCERLGHNLGVKRNVAVGDEVSRLWRKHRHAEFPARLRDHPVSGVDLVALDADIAACVNGWRSGGESLEEDRRKDLTRAIDDLDAVLPLLTSRVESLYFGRLRELAGVLLGSNCAQDAQAGG
jgi:hypothetical protein